MSHDLQTVIDAQTTLVDRGIHIDLLYRAESFASVDRLIKAAPLDEILAKRLTHKRAVLLDGVMVELFLVSSHGNGYHTDFWQRVRFTWPPDVFAALNGTPVASAAALNQYRRRHRDLRAAANDSSHAPRMTPERRRSQMEGRPARLLAARRVSDC